jgi:hypothetical protein
MKRILLFLSAMIFTLFVVAQGYSEIKSSQLPKKATDYLKKNLGTYTMGRAAKSDEKGVIKYAVVAETRGKKAVYVFDKDGNFLDRVKNLEEAEKVKPAATPQKK